MARNDREFPFEEIFDSPRARNFDVLTASGFANKLSKLCGAQSIPGCSVFSLLRTA